MKRILFCCAFFLFFHALGTAQTIVPLTSNVGVSIRGLSILDDRNAWISGTKGTIGQTSDGGNHWNWLQVPGFENRDFRDIELIDTNTAVIMAIDTPAVILRTTDRGLHWSKVLEDKRPGMFLDAMSFSGKKAVVIGDPINGQLYIAQSENGGKTWKELEATPPSENGCFASSGTNIAWRGPDYFSVTGGIQSMLYWNNSNNTALPLMQGKQSAGANSIAINPDLKAKIGAVIVGGDFNNKEKSDSNCILVVMPSFQNRKMQFEKPEQAPQGYKSCVVFINRQTLIATGTSGTDLSNDEGLHWIHFSEIPFHVVQKAKKGNLILLAGPNGTIARLEH